MVLARDEKTLGTLALPEERQFAEYGSRFRPVRALRDVPAWTDSRADVSILAFSPPLQELRRLFGPPVPPRDR